MVTIIEDITEAVYYGVDTVSKPSIFIHSDRTDVRCSRGPFGYSTELRENLVELLSVGLSNNWFRKAVKRVRSVVPHLVSIKMHMIL